MKYRIFAAVLLGVATLLALRYSTEAQFGGRGGNDPRSNFPGANPAAANTATAAAAAAASANEPPPPEEDMVLLTVSVAPPEKSALPTLQRDNFQVLEDGKPQKITYFWQDNRPYTVGLLVDDSDYMTHNHKLDDLRETLPAFLKGKNPLDEYFVVQFDSFPRMTVSYTYDAKLAPTFFRSMDEQDAAPPNTALSDAIYLGLEAIKEGANFRKALLVITAGGDKGCDGKQLTLQPEQLLGFAIKQPVQIYSMLIVDDWGIADNGNPCNQIPADENNLDLLSGATGGKAYLASNSEGGVNSIATEVARALKTQFLIGFHSTNPAKDGHRRGIKVKLNPPEGAPKLSVWSKNSYYAPKGK